MLPGLWHAVESKDNVQTIEMLDNWSRIDITMDGKNLVDRAKEIGNQEIIETLQVCNKPR